MHQNVKMEKEQHTALNKALIFISPILDMNVSTKQEMGKILVSEFTYELKMLLFIVSIGLDTINWTRE